MAGMSWPCWSARTSEAPPKFVGRWCVLVFVTRQDVWWWPNIIAQQILRDWSTRSRDTSQGFKYNTLPEHIHIVHGGKDWESMKLHALPSVHTYFLLIIQLLLDDNKGEENSSRGREQLALIVLTAASGCSAAINSCSTSSISVFSTFPGLHTTNGNNPPPPVLAVGTGFIPPVGFLDPTNSPSVLSPKPAPTMHAVRLYYYKMAPTPVT